MWNNIQKRRAVRGEADVKELGPLPPSRVGFRTHCTPRSTARTRLPAFCTKPAWHTASWASCAELRAHCTSTTLTMRCQTARAESPIGLPSAVSCQSLLEAGAETSPLDFDDRLGHRWSAIKHCREKKGGQEDAAVTYLGTR